jgi:hypothetical protein
MTHIPEKLSQWYEVHGNRGAEDFVETCMVDEILPFLMKYQSILNTKRLYYRWLRKRKMHTPPKWNDSYGSTLVARSDSYPGVIGWHWKFETNRHGNRLAELYRKATEIAVQ